MTKKCLTNDVAHYIWFGGSLHKRKTIRKLILGSVAVHLSLPDLIHSILITLCLDVCIGGLCIVFVLIPIQT